MGVIAEGILRGCQGLFTPVSLGYPLSVFNKNSTLKQTNSKVLWEYEHWKGVYQNWGKTSKSSFLETVFSRAKYRLSGNKTNFLGNKFSNKIAHP